MSLFSTLYSGASGMLAHSRATEITSNNIANSNTVGYKRSDTRFSDLMADHNNRSTSNNTITGGVMATQISRIRDQGPIQQTTSSTDMAIAGNGFFVVNTTTDGSGDFLYTRAGQFTEDATGILKNTAGYTLFGYATDFDGNAQGEGIDSLVPVDLSLYPQQHFESTAINLAMNLDNDENAFNTHISSPSNQLPISGITAPNYSRSISVYDQSGTPQQIKVEYRRVVAPTAHFSSKTSESLTRSDVLVDYPEGKTDGITTGNILQLSDGTDILDITFTGTDPDLSANEARTVEDVINIVNAYTGSGTEPLYLASLDENGRLLFQARNPSTTIDISGSTPSVLGNTGLNVPQDPDATPDYTYEPDFDITAAPDPTSAYPGQSDFPAFANTTNPNVYNWWEMTVNHIATDGTETQITQGLLNFDGDGRLNTGSAVSASAQDVLTLNAADLPFTTTGDITMDITRLTQYSGTYDTLDFTQNGAPETALRTVNITAEGMVMLQFESDLSRPVYKIPLATFNNPDALERVNGTAFQMSTDSGIPTLSEARTGGAGIISASALESANVDISDEFGDLIVTQRAYSMNSQVVQAANEMAQTAAQLKR